MAVTLTLGTGILLFIGAVAMFACGIVLGLKNSKKGTPSDEAAPAAAALPAEVESQLRAEILKAAQQEVASQAFDWYAHLRGVADDVAANIGQHNKTVASINAELQPQNKNLTPDVVLAVVARMATANQHLQKQLDSATETIEKQTKQIETQVAEARTDALTDCSNRRALDAELARRLQSWRTNETPLAMAILDVDHFKKFNDSYGHQAGDEVLKAVGAMLQKTSRNKDFVARYGGEEFVVLYHEATPKDAQFAAERSRNGIDEMVVRVGGQDLKVTASFGVVMPMNTDDVTSLLKRADEALYAAKRGGRNCSYYHDGKVCTRINLASNTPETGPSYAESQLDATTRLPNRAVFRAALDQQTADGEPTVPATVMLVDVNRLEFLTDNYGEDSVNIILRATAQILAAAVRRGDLVCRYSQKSFAVLLSKASAAQIAQVAERIRSAIEACESLKFDGKTVRFTVSVGLTETQEGDDSNSLLRRALAAIIRADDEGGNRVCCQPAPHSSLNSETCTANL